MNLTLSFDVSSLSAPQRAALVQLLGADCPPLPKIRTSTVAQCLQAPRTEAEEAALEAELLGPKAHLLSPALRSRAVWELLNHRTPPTAPEEAAPPTEPAPPEEVAQPAAPPSEEPQVPNLGPKRRGRPPKVRLEAPPAAPSASAPDAPPTAVAPAAVAPAMPPADYTPPMPPVAPTPDVPPEAALAVRASFLKEVVGKAFVRLGVAMPTTEQAIRAVIGSFKAADGTPCTKMVQIQPQDTDAFVRAIDALRPTTS